ncbi:MULTISPECIES: hypothetical protein [Paraburkholderia]|uniref:Luciferase-like domain-containing protein n=1 Tax=Paraburkholderia steynii TaxID=1245441 RepID=A0A4R0XFE5_9BURK|nr:MULTISPECIES: hypothetical protein [Paraburkholderia]MDH6152536.1 hypothetical protein [Paraburkholderia sp. WSM4179]TCG07515.1 hypothetical protein BZM27_18635 [Paraburkholderia steynii]
MSDSAQRYGLFLNVENPDGDARDALTQTVRNAPAARTFGYHEVWLAEHNYRSYANSSALALLFAHIATRFRCHIGLRGYCRRMRRVRGCTKRSR